MATLRTSEPSSVADLSQRVVHGILDRLQAFTSVVPDVLAELKEVDPDLEIDTSEFKNGIDWHPLPGEPDKEQDFPTFMMNFQGESHYVLHMDFDRPPGEADDEEAIPTEIPYRLVRVWEGLRERGWRVVFEEDEGVQASKMFGQVSVDLYAT